MEQEHEITGTEKVLLIPVHVETTETFAEFIECIRELQKKHNATNEMTIKADVVLTSYSSD